MDLQIGNTYGIDVVGSDATIVGIVREVTEELISLEAKGYHLSIKQENIRSVLEMQGKEQETYLDILLRQKYVRVPAEEIANQLAAEVKQRGFQCRIERIELCDMAVGGHGVTFYMEIYE